MCRRLLTRETNVATWRELTRVYRRLEARGEIRGGRFVTGMSGEQFALPEAVERLREVRRTAADGRLVTISAADPLNLVGIVTAGDRIRAAGRTRIVYRDGAPLAVMEGDFVRELPRLIPRLPLRCPAHCVRDELRRSWSDRGGSIIAPMRTLFLFPLFTVLLGARRPSVGPGGQTGRTIQDDVDAGRHDGKAGGRRDVRRRFVIGLRPDLAPNHVGYFIKLAKEGAFNGTIFHRVIRLAIIQGGDPLSKDPAKAKLYGTGGLGVLAPEFSAERATRGRSRPCSSRTARTAEAPSSSSA